MNPHINSRIWFAWYPVKLEDSGYWVWMQKVRRLDYYIFHHYAPCEHIKQFWRVGK